MFHCLLRQAVHVNIYGRLPHTRVIYKPREKSALVWSYLFKSITLQRHSTILTCCHRSCLGTAAFICACCGCLLNTVADPEFNASHCSGHSLSTRPYLHCKWVNFQSLLTNPFFTLLSGRWSRLQEIKLTCAEVGELSRYVGPLIIVHLFLTTERSEAHRGNTVIIFNKHPSLSSLLWPTHTLFVPNMVYRCHAHTDSRGVPHREVNVAVWQCGDTAHGGLHFVSEGSEAWRVIGQAHPVPSPCKLHTHKHTIVHIEDSSVTFHLTTTRVITK